MNLTRHDKFSFIIDSSKSLRKWELNLIDFPAKDLSNSLIIDIRSIVFQRLIKISSTKGRKTSPRKETDTQQALRAAMNVADRTTNGWSISLLWGMRWPTSPLQIQKLNLLLERTNHRDHRRWKIQQLTNIYLRINFKTNAKCKSPRYKTTTTNYSWRLNIQ